MAFFFTADTHFGHERIIDLCNRPFKTVEDQTRGLIERWNNVVSANDHVFVIGDFAFKADRDTQLQIFTSLNGTKSLISGNHDHSGVKELPWTSYNACKPELAVTSQLRFRYEKQTYFMNHYAMRTWPEDHHDAIHLFGHSHGTLPDLGRSTDVGVDCWNYTPVSTAQIKQYFAKS